MTAMLLVSTRSVEALCVRAALHTAWKTAKSVSAGCLRWVDAKRYECEAGEGNWSGMCAVTLMLSRTWLNSKAALRLLLAPCLLTYLLYQ